MKILHTADWHIGKQLYRQDLYPDHCRFFDWLISYVKENVIDVLLVSGDIFDLANPSHRDTTLYYDVLRRLNQAGTRVIITGGNHDSVTMLNAPKDLLRALNITVIGGVPENFRDQIIPLYNKERNVSAIVLAVPFLRDRDLRTSVEANLAEERFSAIRRAVKSHYQTLIEIVSREFDAGIPVIAMGHLFMTGALTSDSEREIHIGNLDGMPAGEMPEQVNYWALGHIHKPQIIGGNSMMRYSGSPLFLDFSESSYAKIVIELTVDQGKISEVTQVRIPLFRSLVRLKGNFEEVEKQVADLLKNLKDYPVWAEIEVKENQFSPMAVQQLESLQETYESENFRIIKSRIITESPVTSGNEFVFTDRQIEDLEPIDIFNKKMDEQNIEASERDILSEAYKQILTEILEDD